MTAETGIDGLVLSKETGVEALATEATAGASLSDDTGEDLFFLFICLLRFENGGRMTLGNSSGDAALVTFAAGFIVAEMNR